MAKRATEVTALKKEMRKRMAELLKAVEGKEAEEQSRIVTEKILSSALFTESRSVSVFVSTTGEICTDDLIRHCFRLGKQVFVPQFEKGNKNMRMVRLPNVEAFETLPATLWNIRQPALDQKWEDYYAIGAIDAVFVPGVAFTEEGQRLGHGMGYYDRWFVEHETHFGKKPLTAGLALRQQIVSSVPTSEHDVLIDNVFFAA